jgi:hypothetical protein
MANFITDGQRIRNADLFGPLKTYEKGKKFILCIFIQISKTAKSAQGNHALLQIINQPKNQHQLAALANNQPLAVAEAPFCHWFCHKGFLDTIHINALTKQCQELQQELKR